MALNCAVYRRFIHLGTAKQNADIKRGLWTAKVKERESARTQMADLRPVGDDFKPRRTDFMPVRPVRAEFWSVKGLYDIGKSTWVCSSKEREKMLCRNFLPALE